MKTTKPTISVIMPLYNSQDFVGQTIESVLNQTYTNFEFIIIDDASTDNSFSIARKYAKTDKRIRLYKNKINLGVALTSNIAISLVKSKFLARIDSDDVALPDRLEKQLHYLTQNKSAVAVGGQCTLIDEDNKVIGTKNFPISGNLADMLFWAVPMQQPTMMINLKKLPKTFKWYEASKTSAEEITVMFNLSRYGKLSNISDTTLFYRIRPNSLSHINPKHTFWLTIQSRINALHKGFKPSFSALVICLAQIFIVSITPSKLLYGLYYTLRNLKLFGTKLQKATARALELNNA